MQRVRPASPAKVSFSDDDDDLTDVCKQTADLPSRSLSPHDVPSDDVLFKGHNQKK